MYIFLFYFIIIVTLAVTNQFSFQFKNEIKKISLNWKNTKKINFLIANTFMTKSHKMVFLLNFT